MQLQSIPDWAGAGASLLWRGLVQSKLSVPDAAFVRCIHAGICDH